MFEMRLDVLQFPKEGISLKELEKAAILQALEKNKWNQRDASLKLGISERVISYKIKTLGLGPLLRQKRREHIPDQTKKRADRRRQRNLEHAQQSAQIIVENAPLAQEQ